MFRSPRRRLLLAVAALALVGGGAVWVMGRYRGEATAEARPTPEQRYFDWTTLPFDAGELAARRDRLRERLSAGGGGVYLAPSQRGVSEGFTFRQLDDFYYFTGLELPDSVLAIDADGEAIVFAPRRDARFENPSRRNDFPGRPLADDPEIARRAGITIEPIEALAPFLAGLAASGRTARVNPGAPGEVPRPTLTFTADWTPEQHFIAWLRATYPALTLSSAYDAVATLRMIKSNTEIALMRRAASVGATGIAHAAGFVKAGVDERTLEGELEAYYKRHGSARLGFSSIIKSGPNALWPWRILAAHAERRNRQMQDGELVIFDVGCEIGGYTSDVGRTFPVSGEFSDEQRAILEMEVAVSDALIAAMRPGVTLAEVQRAGAEAIPAEHRPYMQTGFYFGHHIGLSSGDPNLMEATLQPGMVITVEPWYYNHDRGISVFTEDDILITATGAENLTAEVPRTPDALERLLRP
ncbi:MAG: aminopeptidase P N-terminal domain-containing protein [Vicinamibacterales bacterium]